MWYSISITVSSINMPTKYPREYYLVVVAFRERQPPCGSTGGSGSMATDDDDVG